MKMTITAQSMEEFSEQLRRITEKAGLTEEEKAEFCERTLSVLALCRDRLGADTPIDCELMRRFTHIEVILKVKGADLQLSESPERRQEARLHRIRSYLVERKTAVTGRYLLGKNLVLIRSPEFRSKLSFLKNPMLVSVVIGIAAGLICRILPSGLSSFFIDGLVSPVLSLITSLMTGIMGPVMFISLISAIASLNSIERLNALGLGILRRFLLVLTLLSLTAVGVCALMYRNFGSAATLFDPSELVSMLLALIPINLLRPFTENDFSQIVVLGAAFGTALLMIGKKGRPIVLGISALQQWMNTVWGFIRRLSPLIPMLNLAKVFYNDQFGVVLDAWRYFVTVLASAVLFCTAKLLVASVRCHVGPLLLLRKLKPLLVAAFTYGSHTTVMNVQSELAQEKLGISATFSDFWIPMNVAVFTSTNAIVNVCASFYAAFASGTTFSVFSVVVLVLLSVQFSLVSPGLVPRLTILFTQLGIPLDYVGIFSVCSLVTKNFIAFSKAMIAGLEELQAAYRANEVDPAVLCAE